MENSRGADLGEGFQVEVVAKPWRWDCTWHGQGRGPEWLAGSVGGGKCLGAGFCLAPEPMVQTTVLHSLTAQRNNKGKPERVPGEKGAKPWVPALLGDTCSQTMKVMGERELSGNWFSSPVPGR